MTSRSMRAVARKLPDLRAGFWLLTTLVALGGPVLALVIIVIDKLAGHAGAFPALIISPDSARTILGSIAGSLITIASLTSSLTIVTLQLLSNQYTPRTVRGFLSTRLAQFVLGTFIAIFLYCLILLVAVREPGDENAPFVPSLGVVVSLVLAVVGLIVLVVFIHAMSQTIQVSTTVARIATATREAIDRIHRGQPNDGVDEFDAHFVEVAQPVVMGETGWVRQIDLPALEAELGPQTSARVWVRVRPGDFVTHVTPVALAHGDERADSDRVEQAVRAAVVVARERDVPVDPAYGIRQLVDIALRALSPGINDPTTAITCVGYLEALVGYVATRELPRTRVVRMGRTTVTSDLLCFDDYLLPLTELAAYAGSDARMVWALLDALTGIAGQCADAQHRHDVLAARSQIRDAAVDDVRLPFERERLRALPDTFDPGTR